MSELHASRISQQSILLCSWHVGERKFPRIKSLQTRYFDNAQSSDSPLVTNERNVVPSNSHVCRQGWTQTEFFFPYVGSTQLIDVVGRLPTLHLSVDHLVVTVVFGQVLTLCGSSRTIQEFIERAAVVLLGNAEGRGRKRIVLKMRAQCGYHEQTLPILWQLRCILDIDGPARILSEPVSGPPQGASDLIEPKSLCAVKKVRYVLQYEQSGAVRWLEFVDYPRNFKKQLPPFIFEPKTASRLRETLARKSCCQYINVVQSVGLYR